MGKAIEQQKLVKIFYTHIIIIIAPFDIKALFENSRFIVNRVV